MLSAMVHVSMVLCRDAQVQEKIHTQCATSNAHRRLGLIAPIKTQCKLTF